MKRRGSIFAVPMVVLLYAIASAEDLERPQGWHDPSPHSVRFVPVEPGVQLEVLDWGGRGDALVFLAGLAMNAHTFDDFAPRFTDAHRVLGITRRGHGASTWPATGYSLERVVEDIRIVLETLGIESAILAGSSFAGAEMTRFASDYPQRVTGLVYIDAAHDGTLIEQLRLFEVCPSMQEMLDVWQHRIENPDAFLQTQMHEGAEGALTAYASESALDQLASGESTPVYTSVQAPALAVYHVPTWAEHVFGTDAVVSDACISATQRYIYEGIAGFAAGMQRARIVSLAETQHLVHLVSPDALEQVMRRWLAALRSWPETDGAR